MAAEAGRERTGTINRQPDDGEQEGPSGPFFDDLGPFAAIGESNYSFHFIYATEKGRDIDNTPWHGAYRFFHSQSLLINCKENN